MRLPAKVARTYLREVVLRRRGHVSLAIGNGREVYFATASQRSRSWFGADERWKTLHESAAAELVMGQSGPTDFFFDVGAYLGFYTILATTVCSVAEAHAFDIDPANLELIQSSLYLNTTQLDSIHLIPAAIGGKTGNIVTFGPHKRGNLSTQQLIETEWSEGSPAGGMKAVSLSLDDYCQKTRVAPTFVKMDIEGAEALAISGMHWVLGVAAPKILIEVHPERIAEYGGSVSNILATIRSYGYVGRALEGETVSGATTSKSSPIDAIGSGPTKIYFEKLC